MEGAAYAGGGAREARRPLGAGRIVLPVAHLGVMGIGLAAMLCEPAHDLLASGFVVGTAALLAGWLVSLYPSLFSLRTLRIPGLFVFFYGLMIVLPLPWIYAEFDLTGRTTYLVATVVSFLLTIAGILFMNYLVPCRAGGVGRWISAPTRVTPTIRLVSSLLLVLCFGVLVLYLQEIGTPPLVWALTGSQSRLELALAREEALKLIPGRIRYLYSSLRGILFPYTMLLCLSIASQARNWRWNLVFVVSFLGSSFMAGATLAKSPVATSVLMLGFAWLLLRARSLSLRRLFVIGLVALAFPAFVYLAVYQFDVSTLYNRVILGVVRRIFHTPGTVLLHYFVYFPDVQDFLLGRGLPWVSKLFTAGPFPTTNAIGLFITPTAMTSVSAGGAYVGFLWADFGWVGVLLGSFVVGMILQATQLFILRLPKLAPAVVAQAMAAILVINLTSTSITDVLFSTYSGIWNVVALTVVVMLIPLLVRPGWRASAADAEAQANESPAVLGEARP